VFGLDVDKDYMEDELGVRLVRGALWGDEQERRRELIKAMHSEERRLEDRESALHGAQRRVGPAGESLADTLRGTIHRRRKLVHVSWHATHTTRDPTIATTVGRLSDQEPLPVPCTRVCILTRGTGAHPVPVLREVFPTRRPYNTQRRQPRRKSKAHNPTQVAGAGRGPLSQAESSAKRRPSLARKIACHRSRAPCAQAVSRPHAAPCSARSCAPVRRSGAPASWRPQQASPSEASR